MCVCVFERFERQNVKCQIFTLQKCIEAFSYFQLLYLNSFQYSSSQLRSTKTCKWSQKQHQMLVCRNFIQLNRSPFCAFSFDALFLRDYRIFSISKRCRVHLTAQKIGLIIFYYKKKVLGCAMYRNLFNVHVHRIRNLVGFWILLFCLIKFNE